MIFNNKRKNSYRWKTKLDNIISRQNQGKIDINLWKIKYKRINIKLIMKKVNINNQKMKQMNIKKDTKSKKTMTTL